MTRLLRYCARPIFESERLLWAQPAERRGQGRAGCSKRVASASWMWVMTSSTSKTLWLATFSSGFSPLIQPSPLAPLTRQPPRNLAPRADEGPEQSPILDRGLHA